MHTSNETWEEHSGNWTEPLDHDPNATTWGNDTWYEQNFGNSSDSEEFEQRLIANGQVLNYTCDGKGPDG